MQNSFVKKVASSCVLSCACFCFKKSCKMKFVNTRRVCMLSVSTLLLLVLCIHIVVSNPVLPGENSEENSKPTCTAEGDEELTLVEFRGSCEKADGSCNMPCATTGAVCRKIMHHQHSDDANESHDHDNSPNMNLVICICPSGTTHDEEHNSCMEKADEKVDEPEDNPKPPEVEVKTEDEEKKDEGSGSGPSENDNPENPDGKANDKAKEPEEGDAAEPGEVVQDAGEPGEAKSNVGLAVGVITLALFACIFVFLVRHKINNAFRRMCGGSQPVPQHDN